MTAGVDLEIRTMDGDHCTAFWHDVYLHLWNGNTTLDAAWQLEGGMAQLLERHPRGIFILGISRPSAKTVPTTEVRQFLADLFRRYGPRVLGIASVIQGDGFIVAAKRAVTATIAVLARQSAPMKIFADHAEAIDWLASVMRTGRDDRLARELALAWTALERDYDRYLAGSRA